MIDYILFPIRFIKNSIRSFWRYISLSRKLGIDKDSIVLEVGSGHRPMPRSDILLDKFFADSFERAGHNMVLNRPVVIGDAEKIPFKNKSVNYVYSYALIEHLENPEEFIKEMTRVAPQGAVICPSRLHEIFTAFPYHRWFVDIDDNKIILERKLHPYTHASVKNFVDKHMSNYIVSQNLLHFWNWTWNDFYHIFKWKGDIDYKIINHSNVDDALFTFSELDKNSSQDQKPAFLITLMYKIAISLARIFHPHNKIDLFSVIACPCCNGDLVKENKSLICDKCKLKFPILTCGKKEIPVLLIEKAEPSDNN